MLRRRQQQPLGCHRARRGLAPASRRHHARGRRWHEAALRRAAATAAALVVASRFVAADLEASGVDPARLTIVPGGSDHVADPNPNATAGLLRRVGVSGEFLLTVGTLEPRKNIGPAGAGLRAACARPCPGRGRWSSSARPAGAPNRPTARLADGVVLTGAVSDAVLAGLYPRARAFAYVPLTEGYGLPPLEAMRMGPPWCRGSEVPSVHDLGATGRHRLDCGSARRRRHRPRAAAVLTDDALRVDLAARGSAFACPRTWRAAAASTSRSVAVVAMTRPLDLSLDVSAVPPRPAAPATTPWPSPRAWSPRRRGAHADGPA